MLIKMAFRNVFRNRKRSGLTGFTMVGGFVLMAITIALVEGSYGELIDVFTRQHTGHAQLSHPEWAEDQSIYRTLRVRDRIIERTSADPAVRAVAPRIHGDSLVYFDPSPADSERRDTKSSSSGAFGAAIVGIDPKLEEKATSYSLRIADGEALKDPEAYEAVVGQGIAKVLGITVGKDIILISQGADGSIANDVFRVVGIMGGEFESRDDYRIYLPIIVAAEFYSLQGRFHEVAVILHDLDDAVDFVTRQQAAHGSLDDSSSNTQSMVGARSWQQVEKDFYRTMQIDRKGHNFTFFILMVIIGVGILNSILMTTLERTREFGVLKAMGTLPKQIFGLIVCESVILALLAIAVAAGLAFVAITYLSFHGIRFDEALKVSGMVIEEHRARAVPSAFLIPAATVLATTCIASLYPAWRAAKLSVSDCLRDY